jgi:hypothetical protein
MDEFPKNLIANWPFPKGKSIWDIVGEDKVTVHATDSNEAYMHARRRYIRRGLATEASFRDEKCGVRDEMDGGLMCHGRSGMPICTFLWIGLCAQMCM